MCSKHSATGFNYTATVTLWPLCVVDSRLVCGHHILDVDEGIIPTLLLEKRERVVNELAQAVKVALAVVDAVTQVPAAEKGEGGAP